MGSLLKVDNASSTIEVPAKSINQILIDSGIKYIDFLNIDIEGYDELVIKDFNYDLFLPKVIAVEDFSDNFSALLNSNITEHLSSHGYTIVARAGFTSIFKINGFNE